MENEIRVGEYCRTKDGIIDKVIIDYKGKCNNPNCNSKHISCEKNYYNEDDIVKHSPNLIDLIQCGDYVNGYKVDNIEKGKLIIGDTTQVIEQIVENDEIETVVTKEMMESISYKVKE